MIPSQRHCHSLERCGFVEPEGGGGIEIDDAWVE